MDLTGIPGLNSLPEEFKERISKMSQKEVDDLIWELEKDQYDERPVDIDTFIEDPDFLGEHLLDEKTGNNIIFEFWREKLRQIYPSPFYNRYSEVLVMLGIGNGKSTISNISCLYEIYRLLCLKNPQSYHRLMKSTIITFVVFSAKKYIAENVNWPQLKQAFEDSPWFCTNCPIVNEDDGKKVALDKDNCVTLPKGLAIQLGSKEDHTLGRAVIWGVVDEANFQNNTSMQAFNSYNAISQRRTSRFKHGKNVPGVLWIVSSPKSDLDFVAQRMESQKNIPTTLIIKDIPSWEIKVDPTRSGETFKLFIGDNTRDPQIIGPTDNVEDFSPTKVLDVPIEFRVNFEQDLVKAIMDIAGRSCVSDFALFPNASQLMGVCNVPHRAFSNVIYVSQNGPDEIVDFVDRDYFRNLPHLSSNRFIHVDVSFKYDRLGIASTYSIPINVPEKPKLTQEEEYGMGYADLFAEQRFEKTLNQEDGHTMEGDRMYITEFVYYVHPKSKGEEISQAKVIKFLQWLKAQGMPVASVSVDAAARGLFEQTLRNDFNVMRVSVDASKDAYYTLKRLISDSRIIIPNNPVLIKELRELRDMGRKIDHPMTAYDENGEPLFSKDGADCLAATAYAASIAEVKDSNYNYLDPFNLNSERSSSQGLIGMLRSQYNDDKYNGAVNKLI